MGILDKAKGLAQKGAEKGIELGKKGIEKGAELGTKGYEGDNKWMTLIQNASRRES